MIANLNQLLLNHIPSKEIKARLKNKQIKVNNEVVTNSSFDFEISLEHPIELGDFVFSNIEKMPKLFRVIDIKDFFGEEDTNLEGVKFLSNFILISISKREHFVYKRYLNHYQPLFDLIHKEHGLFLGINEMDEIIKQSQKVLNSLSINTSIRIDKFDQYFIREIDSNYNYYLRIEYNGIIYKEVERIVVEGKTNADIRDQILIARKKILLKLFEFISDNIPIPKIN
jgi:hypothetical protein